MNFEIKHLKLDFTFLNTVRFHSTDIHIHIERQDGFPWEKVFLKISQNSQENACTHLWPLSQEFPYEFCEIFKNTCFTQHLRKAASFNINKGYMCSWYVWNVTKPFSPKVSSFFLIVLVRITRHYNHKFFTVAFYGGLTPLTPQDF